ncbi:MAG: Spy/CpxP family protein refolding chaperone [Woeseiaceae bacterium]|nr:Spy/CpxP family protein refolding chaperone [Woeseiaceae bacterium]
MKTLSAVMLAGVLTLALSASALADFGGGPRSGFGPGGPGFGGPEMMLEHMADHLDLNDTQRATVQNILEAARPEFQALREQARANREALRALDVGDPAVNDIAISNGELATQGTLLAHRVRNEVRAVLTDEQIEKLERSRDRMRAAAERRFGR